MGKIPEIKWNVEPIHRFHINEGSFEMTIEDLGVVVSNRNDIGTCYYNAFCVYMGKKPITKNKLTYRQFLSNAVRYHYRIATLLVELRTRIRLDFSHLDGFDLNVHYFIPDRNLCDEDEAFEYAKVVLQESYNLSKLRDKYDAYLWSIVNGNHYTMMVDHEIYPHYYSSTNRFFSKENDKQPPRSFNG